MFAPSRQSTFVDRLRRLFAAGAALLVLLLATLAANPELHHWLHDNAANENDGCAVMLFANGVSAPVDPVAITAPDLAWQPGSPRPVSEIFLVPARYLRQPERGPPVS